MAAQSPKHHHIPGIAGGDLPTSEQQAFEEGHDADVPNPNTSNTSSHPQPEQHAEIEKGSKRDGSSTSSINGDHDVEKGGPIDTTTSAEGEDAKEGEEAPRDPNIVDWEGPDDPQNPMNWTASKKWANIAILSFLTLLTPLASSMFAPGVPDVIKEFHSTKYVDAVVSLHHRRKPVTNDDRLQCFPGDIRRFSLHSRFRSRSARHRSFERDVRPSTHLQHLQRSLRRFHRGLRCCPVHGLVDRVSIPCGMLWYRTYYEWRWYHCGYDAT